MFLFSISLTFAALNFAAVHGQTLPKEIVGCADIGCPLQENRSSINCNVVDKSFYTIGLARIPGTSTALNGLSWTQGVAVTDDEPNKSRTFEKNFYLGTPPSTNLNGTGGCAVFFNKARGVKFPENGNDIKSSTGKCQDAIDSSCLDGLSKTALDIADGFNMSSQEACRALLNRFKDSSPKSCENLPWDGLTILPLSGENAPAKINSTANSTSNCWPITPKSDDLTLVNTVPSQGDYNASTIEEALYSITPILTVFYPGNGTLINKPEAHFTCLKGITNLSPGAGNQSNGTTGGDPKKSAAAVVSPIFGAVTLTLAMGLHIFVM
ncbi:hypothetical protein HYFRA_00004092 [Hymenoscyphus fraxineus]|uniref:Uncharacterized protein n=1 Tax=Hymenoscyphus fraxineus TaxID=746836 RepID=A0A9N9KL78_9HELO|nr:hypothetical protein HYFRA_00004092 [Hymenoscyphus fraxineus]